MIYLLTYLLSISKSYSQQPELANNMSIMFRPLSSAYENYNIMTPLSKDYLKENKSIQHNQSKYNRLSKLFSAITISLVVLSIAERNENKDLSVGLAVGAIATSSLSIYFYIKDK